MDKNIFYIYNEQNEVVEIRTKIFNQMVPMYVIQYPQPRKSPTDKIRYRCEMVDEKKFYSQSPLPTSFLPA